MSAALYIHFPFCRHRCIYCDFYSEIDLTRIKAFVTALHEEIDMQSRLPVFHNKGFSTLYFGGGTPSLLPPDDLAELLHHLQNAFFLSPNAEVSLEANPGTVMIRHLQDYVRAGITRLTMGVQSFVDAELKTLTRIHSAQEAISAYEQARQSGIQNIGLDLIFGIPGQTMQSWQFSLQAALNLRPEHLSVYGLTYEPDTTLTRMAQTGKITRAGEELERDMFFLAKHTLEAAGYEHYEISNYALPNYRSRHNQKYWDFSPYLGLGPSAHSFDGSQRWWNVADLAEYTKRLKADKSAIEDFEDVTDSHRLEEIILLGLRCREGINLSTWRHQTGMDLLTKLGPAIQSLGGLDSVAPFAPSEKLITYYGDSLALTESGLLLYDTVCRIFFDIIF